MKNQMLISFILLGYITFAYCQVDSTVKVFKQELTQDQLKSGNQEALLWGQSKDRFQKCSIENKYYDIINNNWTMTKEFKDSRKITESHDGLIISWSYNFINFDQSFIGKRLESKIKFDNDQRYFHAIVQNSNQGCGYNGFDAANTNTMYTIHSAETLKVFIDASLSGSDQKLGIRDLTIQTVKCIGANTMFSPLDGKCYCKAGYSQQNINFRGTILKICQK